MSVIEELIRLGNNGTISFGNYLLDSKKKVLDFEVIVESGEDLQLTLELEPETEYKILIDNVNVGKIKTNMAGKVNFSIEMQQNVTKTVEIKKIG